MVDTHREAQLKAVITSIQQRWGTKAICKLGENSLIAAPFLPTTFSQLDNLLEGGIPKGRITEIVGVPTSGTTTLALKIIQSAQANNEEISAYIAKEQTLDLDYATRTGVDVNRVLFGFPKSPSQLLELICDLVTQKVAQLIVVNVPPEDFDFGYEQITILRRLSKSLIKTSHLVVFLSLHDPILSDSLPNQTLLTQIADLRLQLTNPQWIRDKNDILGYEAQIHVLKHKLIPKLTYSTASIEIRFDGVVDGDGV